MANLVSNCGKQSSKFLYTLHSHVINIFDSIGRSKSGLVSFVEGFVSLYLLNGSNTNEWPDDLYHCTYLNGPNTHEWAR